MAKLCKITESPLPPMTNKEKLVSIRAEIPNDLKLKFKAKCALADSDMRTELIRLIEEYVGEKNN